MHQTHIKSQMNILENSRIPDRYPRLDIQTSYNMYFYRMNGHVSDGKPRLVHIPDEACTIVQALDCAWVTSEKASVDSSE